MGLKQGNIANQKSICTPQTTALPPCQVYD